MEINELISLISTTGFPIAVTCFLLWERVKGNQKNNEALNELKTAIEINTEVMKHFLNTKE